MFKEGQIVTIKHDCIVDDKRFKKGDKYKVSSVEPYRNQWGTVIPSISRDRYKPTVVSLLLENGGNWYVPEDILTREGMCKSNCAVCIGKDKCSFYERDE